MPDVGLIFARCDLNLNGYISWHEFQMAACDKHSIYERGSLISNQTVRFCFERFDISQKECLSYDDFERFFGKFSEL